MKTVIAKLVVAMGILTTGAMAQADVPAWVCALNFKGTSKSVQIIVGHSEFNGTGTVRCVSASQERVEYPITVKMSTKPLAPKIGLGKMELYGEALQIAISNGTPEALLGNYVIAEGRAAIIGGAGVIAAVRAADQNLSLSISLQLVKGFGFDLGFRKMVIALDPTRMN
ncbi:hypothetical protein K2P97_09295 [bacterium]|nr:hypothetical protein [bacterium]